MTFPSKLSYCAVSVVCLLSSMLCLAQKRHPLVTFQVPGSQATYPMSINEAQTITGFYLSKSGVTRGFVRDAAGCLSTFDVPGSMATIPVSIDAAGDITGYYEVAITTDLIPDVPLGFLRAADGTITTFGNSANSDDPSSFWAQPVGINVAGEILGNYPNLALASNVFVESPTGVVSKFTLSGGALYSTVATGLNASGAVVGYASSSGLNFAQGFLWDGQNPPPSPVSSAGVTSISVEGSTATFPTAINADGTVVGCYATNGVFQDFVRSPDGTITTLNLPGTVPGCMANFTSGLFNVIPQSININDLGTIIGYFIRSDKIPVAFVRFGNGNFTTFDRRGSMQTIPTSINNDDVIIGYLSQGQEIVGFIREP